MVEADVIEVAVVLAGVVVAVKVATAVAVASAVADEYPDIPNSKPHEQQQTWARGDHVPSRGAALSRRDCNPWIA